MSSSLPNGQPQAPRILKATTLSGDVFVVPSGQGQAAGGDARAVPFVPPRLDQVTPLEWVEAESPAPEPEPVAAPPPPDPTPEILAAAHAQAAAVTAAAEGHAAALLQQARQDAADLLEEARLQREGWEREAYAEGYDQGLAAAQQASRQQVETAGNLLAAAQQARQGLLAGVEPDVIRLVLAIAEKVIRREAGLDSGMVVETVKESLRRLGGRAIARVRVHPAAVETLNEVWHQLTPLAREIELVPDERVGTGGCVVESRNGEIDAQLDTQLALIAGQLLAVAEPEQAGVAAPAG